MNKHKLFTKIIAGLLIAFLVLTSMFTLIFYLVNYVFK